MGKLLARLWDKFNGITPGVYDCCQHCTEEHVMGTHRDAPCLNKGCVQSRERPEHQGLAA